MTLDRRLLFLLLLPGVGYLVALFGLPLLHAVASSVGLGLVGTTSTGFTLENYLRIFTDPVLREGLLFSVYLSIVPTLTSLAIAFPFALLLNESFPGKAVFKALYKIPLVIPSIVAAFIVMVLFDRGGMLSRMIAPLGLSMPKMVRDDMALGVIVALVWKAVPFMTLIIGGAVAAIPQDMRDAVRVLGGNRWTVVKRVELPMAMPGITAATLLTFVSSTGAFAIPSILGPIYPKPLSVWMYESALTDNDWALASAMGGVLTLVSCLVLGSYYWLVASRAGLKGELR